MSGQLGDPKIKNFKSENRYEATDKEMISAFNEFDSYYGKYTIDEEKGIVKHHIELSLFPNWNGTTQERTFEFQDNHLILKAVVEAAGFKAILTWKKL